MTFILLSRRGLVRKKRDNGVQSRDTGPLKKRRANLPTQTSVAGRRSSRDSLPSRSAFSALASRDPPNAPPTGGNHAAAGHTLSFPSIPSTATLSSMTMEPVAIVMEKRASLELSEGTPPWSKEPSASKHGLDLDDYARHAFGRPNKVDDPAPSVGILWVKKSADRLMVTRPPNPPPGLALAPPATIDTFITNPSIASTNDARIAPAPPPR